MENEIMNKEVAEEIVETGKNSGLKKGAITVGVVGLTVGLAFVGTKLVKKLVAKVKARKIKSDSKELNDDFCLDDDFDEIETNND